MGPDKVTSVVQSQLPQAIVAQMAAQGVCMESLCGEGRLVWRRWGTGAPILLLHGAHGSWLHWINNISQLSLSRTVWVPDIPGFGHSAVPTSDPSIDDIASALANGLESLGICEPLDVLGFSFGGTVAAHLAALAPDCIKRIILIDCGGLGTPLAEIKLRRVRRDVNDMEAHRHNLGAMMIHDPTKVDDLALHVQAVHVPLARLNVHDMVLPDRLLRAIERIDAPIDAIWGEFDQPHPDALQQLAALKSVRPNARLRVIPGVGHWSIYENAPAFNAHLAGLLHAKG